MKVYFDKLFKTSSPSNVINVLVSSFTLLCIVILIYITLVTLTYYGNESWHIYIYCAFRFALTTRGIAMAMTYIYSMHLVLPWQQGALPWQRHSDAWKWARKKNEWHRLIRGDCPNKDKQVYSNQNIYPYVCYVDL